MEVNAFLSDSVVNADGKLYVQGAGWNVINVRGLPVRHDRIGIGIVIDVPYTATNQAHQFSVRLEDEDGNAVKIGEKRVEAERVDEVKELGGQFNIGRPPTLPAGHSQIVPLAVVMNGIMFEQAGGYAFIIEIDGAEVKRLPFRVQLPPNVGA